VGLWDVDCGSDAPVVTFEPHSRPVAGLRVLPGHHNQLLSCSHDGAVRCLDLALGSSASFVEVYRAPEDLDGDYPSLHGISRTVGAGGAAALCRSDGAVAMLDLRVAGGNPAMFEAHDKKVFSVDFSPTQPWLLATASLDRTVRLWDVRTLGSATRPKRVAELPHGLSVTAARFSPNGSRLLTTCNDDVLRVFESPSWGGKSSSHQEPAAAVRHNNKTGRYLTAFQAEWVRGSDELFVCGSLEQPRGIDVFRASDGSAQDRMEHENVTAVVSLLAWHPSLQVLATSNASGKVHVWRA